MLHSLLSLRDLWLWRLSLTLLGLESPRNSDFITLLQLGAPCSSSRWWTHPGSAIWPLPPSGHHVHGSVSKAIATSREAPASCLLPVPTPEHQSPETHQAPTPWLFKSCFCLCPFHLNYPPHSLILLSTWQTPMDVSRASINIILPWKVFLSLPSRC